MKKKIGKNNINSKKSIKKKDELINSEKIDASIFVGLYLKDEINAITKSRKTDGEIFAILKEFIYKIKIEDIKYLNDIGDKENEISKILITLYTEYNLDNKFIDTLLNNLETKYNKDIRSKKETPINKFRKTIYINNIKKIRKFLNLSFDDFAKYAGKSKIAKSLIISSSIIDEYDSETDRLRSLRKPRYVFEYMRILSYYVSEQKLSLEILKEIINYYKYVRKIWGKYIGYNTCGCFEYEGEIKLFSDFKKLIKINTNLDKQNSDCDGVVEFVKPLILQAANNEEIAEKDKEYLDLYSYFYREDYKRIFNKLIEDNKNIESKIRNVFYRFALDEEIRKKYIIKELNLVVSKYEKLSDFTEELIRVYDYLNGYDISSAKSLALLHSTTSEDNSDLKSVLLREIEFTEDYISYAKFRLNIKEIIDKQIVFDVNSVFDDKQNFDKYQEYFRKFIVWYKWLPLFSAYETTDVELITNLLRFYKKELIILKKYNFSIDDAIKKVYNLLDNISNNENIKKRQIYLIVYLFTNHINLFNKKQTEIICNNILKPNLLSSTIDNLDLVMLFTLLEKMSFMEKSSNTISYIKLFCDIYNSEKSDSIKNLINRIKSMFDICSKFGKKQYNLFHKNLERLEKILESSKDKYNTSELEYYLSIERFNITLMNFAISFVNKKETINFRKELEKIKKILHICADKYLYLSLDKAPRITENNKQEVKESIYKSLEYSKTELKVKLFDDLIEYLENAYNYTLEIDKDRALKYSGYAGFIKLVKELITNTNVKMFLITNKPLC